MRSWPGLLVLVTLLLPLPAQAQEAGLSAGASIGLLSVAAPEGVCSRSESLGATEMRLRLDQRRWGVEIRAGLHSAVGGSSCGHVLIPPQEGVTLDDHSWALPGEGLFTELKLHSPPLGLGARASLGAGWLWSSEVPFLAGGIALRSPTILQRRLRVQLEADALTCRVWYDGVATEWRESRPVRTTREQRSAWEPGVGFRAGVEFVLQ